MVVTPEGIETPASGVTPWVLLLINDDQMRMAVHALCEEAGFGVEVAVSAKDALECLKVMTPSLVVIEDRLYRPALR